MDRLTVMPHAPRLRERARQPRGHQTEAEERLWFHLRAHRFTGLKFKRQKPMGRYILDSTSLSSLPPKPSGATLRP